MSLFSSPFFNKYRKEFCLLVVLLFVAFWTILFSRNTEAGGFLQSLVESRFLSLRNLENLARQIGMYGIFSLGMGLVIITGGIDLSVGSLMALFGTVFFFLLTGSHAWIPAMPWFPALFVILIFAALIGLLHGWLIAKIRMQAFVVTLCGLLGYRGLAQTMTHDTAIGYIDAKHGVAGLERFLQEIPTSTQPFRRVEPRTPPPCNEFLLTGSLEITNSSRRSPAVVWGWFIKLARKT